jgi:hypothetical protein
LLTWNMKRAFLVAVEPAPRIDECRRFRASPYGTAPASAL